MDIEEYTAKSLRAKRRNPENIMLDCDASLAMTFKFARNDF